MCVRFQNVVLFQNLRSFSNLPVSSLIWFLCQIYFCIFLFMCQLCFNIFESNLTINFSIFLFWPLTKNLLLGVELLKMFFLLKKSLDKGLFRFQFQKSSLQNSIPKVNSSKFSIPRFVWTDCQNHQAKTGSFPSNSSPEV